LIGGLSFQRDERCGHSTLAAFLCGVKAVCDARRKAHWDDVTTRVLIAPDALECLSPLRASREEVAFGLLDIWERLDRQITSASYPRDELRLHQIVHGGRYLAQVVVAFGGDQAREYLRG